MHASAQAPPGGILASQRPNRQSIDSLSFASYSSLFTLLVDTLAVPEVAGLRRISLDPMSHTHNELNSKQLHRNRCR